MIYAENEIVANAGLRLREIAQGLYLPADTRVSEVSTVDLIRRMDRAALAISEVYGALSALPLEVEGENG